MCYTLHNRLDAINDRLDENQHFPFLICYDGTANKKEANVNARNKNS